MKVIAVEDTTLSLSDLAKLAAEGPVILTRQGKPLVAIKDLSGSDWESVALVNNPRFIALIDESRQQYREQGGTSLEDLRKELDLKATPRRRPGKKGPPRR